MTTEQDFQDMLDKDPSNWATRLILADWLDDYSDPRAAGYRALGDLRVHPIKEPVLPSECPWCLGRVDHHNRAHYEPQGNHFLPPEWFYRVARLHEYKMFDPVWWAYFSTRRAADEAAALTFVAA